MEIIIDRARPADAAGILEFIRLAGGETDNLSFGAEGLPLSIANEEAYIASMENAKNDIMLVARDGGRIIATASLNRLPRRMNHRGEISVSVLKEYWNRGIGGKMIAKLIDFAGESGICTIDLQVRSDNRAAIHLYEKFGFVKIGSHPSFFRIGNEFISFDFMSLQLRAD